MDWLDTTIKNSRYLLKNTDSNISNSIKITLNKLIQMFDWNLPDTISTEYLEKLLLTKGEAFICRYNGDLTVFEISSGGGVLDRYYRPKQVIIVNPWINFNETIDVNYLNDYVKEKGGVIVKNDSTKTGLLWILQKYAALLNDNEISMRNLSIDLRDTKTYIANDKQTANSINQYLQNKEKGENGYITTSKVNLGMATSESSSVNGGNNLKSLIEYHQYLKASELNELGIQANYNMKRESINSNESQLSVDALLPLPDNMLRCRKQACDLLNLVFDCGASVDYNSAWEKIQNEIEQSEEQGQEDNEPATETKPKEEVIEDVQN